MRTRTSTHAHRIGSERPRSCGCSAPRCVRNAMNCSEQRATAPRRSAANKNFDLLRVLANELPPFRCSAERLQSGMRRIPRHGVPAAQPCFEPVDRSSRVSQTRIHAGHPVGGPHVHREPIAIDLSCSVDHPHQRYTSLRDVALRCRRAVAYFGANYQMLGREPLKYGFYQFRFMRDALRDRSNLDFARMVEGDSR